MTANSNRRTFTSLPWTWPDLACLALICLGILVAIRPFWQPGIASGADMLMGIYRTFELDRSWHSGVLYPRLGFDWMFTYSTPLFEFYPPLVSYGALVFHQAGLGWVESSKAMFTLSLLLAGIGAYVYARWLFGNRRAALVSALAYGLAPYLLTNVYERGAAAECLALALLPWVVWAAHHMLRTRRRGWLWLTAALVALLMLTHNITTLFVLPFMAVYLGLLAWHERSWDRLPVLLLAVILGLGLSAFYWIPALAEGSYTHLEQKLIHDGSSPEANLTSLVGLIQPWVAFDYWGELRFRLSLWQAVLGGLAVVALVWQRKERRFGMGLLAGAILLNLVLQLDVSRVFWQAVPLVRFIQFPWRLLGITSFCVALLIGSLSLLRPLAGRVGWLVAGGLLAIVVYGGLRNLSPQASPLWYQFTSEQVSLVDVFDRGTFGYALFDDYLPIWVKDESTELAIPRQSPSESPASLLTAPRLAVTEESPFRLRLQVDASSAFTLRLHRFYYPGWQVYVNGRQVPTGPSGSRGVVTAELSAGTYPVLVQFQETPLRRFSNALAGLSLLIWIVGMASERRTRIVLFILIIVAILGASLALPHVGGVAAPNIPVSSRASFEGHIQLLGYHLPKTSWLAGETIPVRLYWFAPRAPDDNYKIFLHLVRAPDGERVAQADSQPILSFGPMTRWEPGEVVVDVHELVVASDVPPGTYRILVGLYQPDTMQNLPVTGAALTLPGDRTVLAEITIK
jgi:hypothetical protein